MANKIMKNDNVNKEPENTGTANGRGVNSTSLLDNFLFVKDKDPISDGNKPMSNFPYYFLGGYFNV